MSAYRFLKLKHWQVFLIMLSAPLLNEVSGQSNSLTKSIATLIMSLMYFFWLWSIGAGLNNSARVNKSNLLKIALLYGIVYALAIFIIVNNNIEMIKIIGIILNLLFIGSFLVLVLSASIAIREAGENGISLLMSFLCLLFFPIGIWFIQPKLNQMVTKDV